MKLKKEQNQESGEIKWNFAVQVADSIQNKPLDEIGAEWRQTIFNIACGSGVLGKIVATYEVEKAECHIMDMIRPEETQAETMIGLRGI